MDPSISFDVGTCYLHHGYDSSIMPLIKELGMTIDVENNSPFHAGTSIMDRTPLLDALLISGALSYLKAHRQLWLKTRNVVPAVFAVPASVYLERAGLQSLVSDAGFKWAVVSQGYGWLDRICADRFFEWVDNGLRNFNRYPTGTR